MDSRALAIRLQPYRDRRRWWVAYSGGLDSHVLLHLCHAMRQGSAEPWPPLHAIHINHQLQPQAAAWVAHCRAVCAALGVPLTVIDVYVDLQAGLGLEAAARQARYQAFGGLLGQGELLLQAHHADDQAETVLLRLLRGSGPAALGAIPAERALGAATLARPLLQTSRAALEAYARVHELQWVEDASNADPRHDRNFLRHQVMPALAQRWPAYRDTLGRTAQQAAEEARLLDALAGLDLQRLRRGESLVGEECLRLPQSRRFNLWRYWLREQALAVPGNSILGEIDGLLTAADDAAPVVRWGGPTGPAEMRRFRGHLYAMRSLPDFKPWQPQPWRPSTLLPLAGAGVLSAEPAIGQGLRTDLPLEVRARAGGERCRPAGRRHSQTLRRLLQEQGLEPWWRERLPLIYSGDELVAVADLWVCEGLEAGPGEAGWVIRWERR